MADILVNVGFKVGSANPLDSKAKVQTIAERDALISEGLAYESLRTYVTSEQKWYEYDGSTWNEITEIGEKGDKGDKGDDGDSAFQIAVENGLTTASTEAEWVVSLKGEKGDTGVGIASIEQTTASAENEGINVITCTLENGTTSEFQIRNGEQGLDGFALIPTTQIDDQIGRIWLAN